MRTHYIECFYSIDKTCACYSIAALNGSCDGDQSLAEQVKSLTADLVAVKAMLSTPPPGKYSQLILSLKHIYSMLLLSFTLFIIDKWFEYLHGFLTNLSKVKVIC